MEDKSSFYELLAANSQLTNNLKSTDEKKKIEPIYLAMSWIILFLINASIFHLGYNYAITSMFKLEHSTFLQSMLFYSAIKVLLRGFFSPQ